MIWQLFHRGGLDRAVVAALLARGWAIASGVVSIFFVTRFLSPAEQGYYYTIHSLVALQIFVELGLNFAIVQFVSHEMARLRWGTDGRLEGDPIARRRLQSILSFGVTWFGIAGVVLTVVLVPLGIIFFGSAAQPDAGLQVSQPWVLIVLLAALGLQVNALLAVLEGCNRVADVALIRLAESMAFAAGLWGGLAAGEGLWSLVVASGCRLLVSGAILALRYRRFFGDLLKNTQGDGQVSWRQEIWPFQWRIAVSWASGFFIFSLFTPLLFATHGAVAAGQMGLSLQIISAVNDVAMVWVSTQMPLFGQLIARGEHARLLRHFAGAVKRSVAVLLLGALFVVLAFVYVDAHFPQHIGRAVPLACFLGLCVVCLANHLVAVEAALLRAHKKEPFMRLSVANALATLVAAAVLVPPFGVAGAVGAYAIGSVLVALPGGSVIFFRWLHGIRASARSDLQRVESYSE